MPQLGCGKASDANGESGKARARAKYRDHRGCIWSAVKRQKRNFCDFGCRHCKHVYVSMLLTVHITSSTTTAAASFLSTPNSNNQCFVSK